MTIDLRNLKFTPASPSLRTQGLYGFIQFSDWPWQISEVGVRVARDGRARLSFKSFVDSNGVTRTPVRPVSNGAREALETVVISELKKRGDL